MPHPFDLSFCNIPLINLRLEFRVIYNFVHSNDGESALTRHRVPVQTPLLIWAGMPDDLMTLLLQRAVLGVEAYLPGGLRHVAGLLGSINKELFRKLDNPFSFGAKSAVSNIYDRMPAAVHPDLSLLVWDRPLFDRTVVFYRTVRNPIFHGNIFNDAKIAGVRDAFDHIALLYEWIDSWYDPERLIKGGSIFSGLRQKRAHPLNSGAP